jgi:hypothetical protein
MDLRLGRDLGGAVRRDESRVPEVSPIRGRRGDQSST